MMKVILLGVWLCMVTLGAAYGVMTWQKQKTAAETAHASNAPATLEQLQTKMLNVPIIRDGAVQGYVLAQFVFTVESSKLKELSTKPELIVVDEAFKLIYTGEAIDFRHLRRNDIGALSKLIQDNVNKRYGEKLVHEVLVQELNYLPRDQLRGSG
jgi:flagellar basal body-associated protein FliL